MEAGAPPTPPSLEAPAGPISGDAAYQALFPSSKTREDQQPLLLGLRFFPQTGAADGLSLALEVGEDAGLLCEAADETAGDPGPSQQAPCLGEGTGGSGPE